MRRPSSRKAAVSRVFSCSGIFAQSRTRSGPWLAAKQPTSSAIAQPSHELLVLHADAVAVKAQQVGIGALREKRHVVLFQRLLGGVIYRVTLEDLFAMLPVLRCHRRVLQIVEQLREPVIAHSGSGS